MYWNTNPVNSTHLESLLNKKDVTLQEIMDDEGVLQECKSQNKHLIDYLVRTDVLEKLVSLTTEEPSGNEADTIKYKYPNIACELLTCDVPQLNEKLASDETLLRKLYSFLDSDAPLNPLLASFFSKTFSVLITRKSDQNWYSYQFTCLKVLEFLKMKKNSVKLLLKHLGTSAIMDLVFKLITMVEGSDLKVDILNWLDEQKLVENLVGLLDPSVDSDVHYNASQLLCDVIRTSRINKIEDFLPNKILERIESPETVSLLLDFILKEPKCETSIVGGISVLLTLLEDKCDSGNRHEYDESIQQSAYYLKVVATTTKAILPRLKDFHNILINPPYKPAVRTTITVLEPPLGNTRVEVAKLLSLLVASNNEEINKELAELDTINVLLDLFFKYTWNNFLHTQVQKCLAFAINSDSTISTNTEIQKNCLFAHILSKCRLIQRILEAWQDNETQQTEHNRPRRGYMGHLIEIANNIVQKAKIHSFGALMKVSVDNETISKWEDFVTTKLAEVNEVYNTCLGGSHSMSTDKEPGCGKEDSFADISPQEALAPAFIGEFGPFHEDQFNDDEDILSISATANFQKIDFNLNEDDSDQQAVLFEKAYSQVFQTLNDYDVYAWNQGSALAKSSDNADRDCQPLESSSSDDEEMEPLKNSSVLQKNDISLTYNNMLSSWTDETDVPPAECFNPWESPNINSVASPDLGWADFESAPFVADFGLSFTSDINTTIATSASYEIDTIPLALTPNENNSNIDDIFSKEESQMEKPQVAENNPMSAVYADVESITKATEKMFLNENVELDAEIKEESRTESVVGQKVRKEEVPVNSTESLEVIGDRNNLAKLHEQKELLGQDGILSIQGLKNNVEREPERGDSCQLFTENVQAVPKELAQNSSKEVESNESEDKSANGPI